MTRESCSAWTTARWACTSVPSGTSRCPLQQGVLRHHSPLIDHDFDQLGAIIFIAHFATCSDFTGETLSAMLPAELLDRLNLTAAGFEKARDEYFSCRQSSD